MTNIIYQKYFLQFQFGIDLEVANNTTIHARSTLYPFSYLKMYLIGIISQSNALALKLLYYVLELPLVSRVVSLK